MWEDNPYVEGAVLNFFSYQPLSARMIFMPQCYLALSTNLICADYISIPLNSLSQIQQMKKC